MKTEKKVSKTILQQKKQIKIGGKQYTVAAPTVATLIRVSELISELPQIAAFDKTDIISESLSVAKDCKVIGEIMATFMIGYGKKISLIDKIHCKLLARYILSKIEIKDLNKMFISVLSGMQIGDFFSLTTSLIETNMLRRTKEVVTATTASGL